MERRALTHGFVFCAFEVEDGVHLIVEDELGFLVVVQVVGHAVADVVEGGEVHSVVVDEPQKLLELLEVPAVPAEMVVKLLVRRGAAPGRIA